MQYWEGIADRLSAASWSWGLAARLPETAGVRLLKLIAAMAAAIVHSDELAKRILELEATLL